MSGSNWLVLIAVSVAVGLVVGLVAGFFGLEMPWWSWAIVGVAIAAIASAWEAYRRQKNAPGQTEVEEGAPNSEE